MSDSVQKKISNRDYTASVAQENAIGSAITVMGDKYTVTFDGNNFQTKHLRRIRRNSVTSLKSADTSADKLKEYAREAQGAGIDRFNGRERSTNTLIFLELGEFCQFGAQIIKFLKDDQRTAWTPFGNPPVDQKTITVTLEKCLAYSTSGVGQFRQFGDGDGDVNAGVGLRLTVVVQRVSRDGKNVRVCHYDHANTNIIDSMQDPYFKKVNPNAAANVAGRIVY